MWIPVTLAILWQICKLHFLGGFIRSFSSWGWRDRSAINSQHPYGRESLSAASVPRNSLSSSGVYNPTLYFASQLLISKLSSLWIMSLWQTASSREGDCVRIWEASWVGMQSRAYVRWDSDAPVRTYSSVDPFFSSFVQLSLFFHPMDYSYWIIGLFILKWVKGVHCELFEWVETSSFY